MTAHVAAHLAAEWPRYVGLLEIGLLIACFIALHHGSKPVLPRVTYLTGWGILYVLIVVAAALVINVTGDVEPTLGLKVMSIVLTPVVVGGVVAVVYATRTRDE